MLEHYNERDIINHKFLFASYNHKDTKIVHESIEYLIEQGVQIWFDSDMHNGDDWDTVAQRIINHENCMGVIFFNSTHSYVSEAVTKERQISLDKQKKIEKQGGKFHLFVVNLEKHTTLSLLREIFVSLPDNDEQISKVFSTEQLSVILEMFPDRRIYTYLTDENKAAVWPALFKDIIEKAPETRNKNNLLFSKAKNNEETAKDVYIDFGVVDDKKLSWLLIKYDSSKALLLATDIVSTGYGDNVDKWLNEDFVQTITNQHDRLYSGESLRLLSIEESKEIAEEVMNLGCEWWLADKRGSLQSTVRDDGTVYTNGYNNRRFSKGIRPVLILTEKHIEELLSK